MMKHEDFLLFEERECAQWAVQKMRMDALFFSIDDLAHRVADCGKLIAEGRYDYQQAFEITIKQAERIVEAKNRVLDTASLPSVILPNGVRGS